MAERDIERVLERGFPVPDKGFRENLLQRCLAVLGQDESVEFDDLSEGVVIDDAELEWLAAAGDVSIVNNGDEPFGWQQR